MLILRLKTLGTGSLLAAAALFVPQPLHAEPAEKWPVTGAVMRFQMEIDHAPSDPSAGIVAILQNGGNLPQPVAEAVVIDSTGKELKSECIWNNPREGMGIVFEPPTSDSPVWIYLKPAQSIKNPWTEASAFHPSLLLYTQVGKASLPAANALASEVPVGKNARMGLVPMVADRSNRFGSSDNFVSYYSGWLDFTEAGNVYLATLSSDGSTVLLDGKVVVDWPGIHTVEAGKSGEKGRSVPVTKGIHRLQYFYFNVSKSPQAMLAWRPPGMDPKSTPSVPQGRDWVQSGSVKMLSGESRNGVPVGMFEKTATKYLGFNNEWVDLFELTVPFADQYKGATFSWRLTGGYETTGSTVLWPVIRNGTPVQATLTVSALGGTSTSTRLLYPDTLPAQASIEKLEDRALFCQAFLNQIKGTPRSKRPAEAWTPGMWGTLPEIIEAGEGRELLDELFQHSAEDLQNLAPEAHTKLEDIYYEEFEKDKTGAPALLSSLIAAEKDPARRFRWQLKRVDFYLNELGDTKMARQYSEQLKLGVFRASPEDSALLAIQFGDIERLDGNYDRAQQIYSAAQSEYRRATRASTPAGILGKPAPTPKDPKDNDKDKDKEKGKEGFVIGAASGNETDWRKRTVRETAYFTEVKNLIDQGYLAEARQTLNTWQVEFPLGKLAGDFPLAEASYYAALENYERAVRILKTYRKQVEISKDLPGVMQLEWKCLAELQRLDDLKELASDIKKRFPDLPLAANADSVLAGELPPKPEKTERRVKRRK